MRGWLLVLWIWLACGVGRAETDPLARAEALFDEGRWRAAAQAARAAGTARGYATAARARLIWAGFDAPAQQWDAAVAEAVADARQAVAADPALADGHLQLGAALGFRAQLGRSSRDLRQAKKKLEDARARDSDGPYILAAIGYWHGRTELALGSFMAGLLFDADREKAVAAFEAALAADPDNSVIRIGFGRLLLRFGEAPLRARALRLLHRGAEAPRRTALQQRLGGQADRLIRAADAGGSTERLKELADALAPFTR